MVSLIDLGPAYEPVELRGKTINVKGVPAADILLIMRDFPELRMLMTERQLEPDDIVNAIGRAPRALAMVIASGLGDMDEANIALAAELGFGEQMDIALAAIRMTFPRGPARFLEELTKLMGSVNVGALGKAQDTKSPAPSNDASAPDTTNDSSGEERRVS